MRGNIEIFFKSLTVFMMLRAHMTNDYFNSLNDIGKKETVFYLLCEGLAEALRRKIFQSNYALESLEVISHTQYESAHTNNNRYTLEHN